ncbi:PLAT/LH2 domain-containing lipoxygenase family protein [Actinidia rufa]|uniref:PLAT/LH2 domain-containing lipoxygenase family protein n=1 Tax=Actinidia rufa TaxID=165716 RepID=A0A7J0HGM0_9ERIC|nr:PLAT/LH2 domain-containing lipoxygenase family protein [Actinidia rufa]
MGTCSSTPAMCFAKKRNKSIDNNGGVRKKIKGTAVLMKKNVLDLNDFGASFLDMVHEFLGKGVLLQLVSAVHGDQANGKQGNLGKPAYLEKWSTEITSVTAGDTLFGITFDWDEAIGVPVLSSSEATTKASSTSRQ